MLMSLLRSGNMDIISVITYIISVLMVIFLVNPLHECAHGFVAYKLGDRTAKNQGRLTLNPLAHIDYMGSLLMLLVGFGWAKPVPVNPRNFKNPKVGMAITALAGPVSNLLAAVIFGLCYNTIVTILIKNEQAVVLGSAIMISKSVSFVKYVLMFFEFLIIINISLAVFNLIYIRKRWRRDLLHTVGSVRIKCRIAKNPSVVELKAVAWPRVQRKVFDFLYYG